MSALAILLKSLGHTVVGSDVGDYIFTEKLLCEKQIPIYSFNEKEININDIVIIGHNFINSNLKEVTNAKLYNEWYEYNDFLAKLSNNYISIAISGTHGKTTTTHLIKNIFNEIDQCGYLIGDGTAYLNKESKYFIFEACEYKNHFLKYYPSYIIINNVDYDHIDYFKTKEEYNQAFINFIKNKKEQLIVNGDDDFLRTIDYAIKYGINDNNDIQATNIIENEKGISFDLKYHKQYLINIKLPFYGRHMIYNTLASISIALINNIGIEQIVNGLLKFKGANRRFNEEIIEDNIYIDDYAHHPNEIKNTIYATKQKYPNKKLVAIFKGDRYSRIQYFSKDIARELELAEEAYVLPFPPCSKKEEGINISEEEIIKHSPKIKKLSTFKMIEISKYSNTVYLFMSSKNMKNEREQIIKNKFKIII